MSPFPPLSDGEVEGLADTLAIPVDELKQLAMRAGLEAIRARFMESSEVTFPLQLHAAPKGTLPVYLPTEDVTLLREICEAAEVPGGIDRYVALSWTDEIRESLLSKPGRFDSGRWYSQGACSFILECGWTDDDDRAERAMLEVVDRWKSR